MEFKRVWFTTVPLKPLTDRLILIYIQKRLYSFILVFLFNYKARDNTNNKSQFTM